MDIHRHLADANTSSETDSYANAGLVVGFVLCCLGTLILSVLCCCFEIKKSVVAEKKLTDKAQECLPDLVETDSSGSSRFESQDVAAIDLFLKGRQAGLSEGFKDEPMDSYAIGFMDGTRYASNKVRDSLTDDQILHQAMKLGYTGASAEGYVEGFQNGASIGKPSEIPTQQAAFETGLLNAEARGLTGKDQQGYAKGYAFGVVSQERLNDHDLAVKAESNGFYESLSDLFAAGYIDGINGVITTDILSTSAALQKGLANAALLGLSDDSALAHATGFQDGYAAALVGDGQQSYSVIELLDRASQAGFVGAAAERHSAGFEEGLDEGNTARDIVLKKGFSRAGGLGLQNEVADAFAIGYIDGCVHATSGSDVPVPDDDTLKEKAECSNLYDSHADGYIRGFQEGHKTSQASEHPEKEILHPEGVFEKGYEDGQTIELDSEDAAAYAVGRQDGYCYGLIGGTIKSEDDIFSMADDHGLEDDEAQVYISGFKSGVIEGNQAREAAFLKGKGKAISLGISGEDVTAYSNGYCDGHTLTISGEKRYDMSESGLKKRAKKLKLARALIPFYVNGFQDGHRDGFESLKTGHVLSSDAAYASGVVDAKALGMYGDATHAYSTGYSDGYQRGLRGGDEIPNEDIAAAAVEQCFDSRKLQKAYTKGFNEGFDNGLDCRQKQATKVLSPLEASQKGQENAVLLKLNEVSIDSYAEGYGEGYCIGVNGQQRPSDSVLIAKLQNLDKSVEERVAHTDGFRQGFMDGAAAAVNKNVVILEPDAALQKGRTRAINHGMKGDVEKGYSQGYHDGYAVGVAGTDMEQTSTLVSWEDINAKASCAGFVDSRQAHGYIAGYLAGQADGGAGVLHHSLCDVHRCHSTTCGTCATLQSPRFLSVPQGYCTDETPLAEKHWWKKDDACENV